METRRLRNRWAAAVLLACAGLAGAGCKRGPNGLPVGASGELVQESGQFAVRLTVQTAPGARVSVDGAEARGDLGQLIPGEYERRQGVADAQGRLALTFRVPRPTGPGVPLTVSARVPGAPGLFRGSAGGSGLQSVTVPVAPALVSERDRLSCVGMDCSVTFERAAVRASGLPAGAELRVGEQSARAAGVYTTVPLDLAALLAPVPAAVLSGANVAEAPGDPVARDYHVELPVRVSRPGGATLQGTLRLGHRELRQAAFQLFRAVRDHAVALPGDGAGGALLVVPRELGTGTGMGFELLGSAQRVADIGRIALRETRTRTASCGRYRNRANGEMIDIQAEMRDVWVGVYDRRSGSRLGERLFRAPAARCDAVAYSRAGNSSSVPPEQITTWLQGFAPR